MEKTKDQQLRKAFVASEAMFPSAQRGLKGYIVWIGKKYPEDAERRSFARNNACKDVSHLPYLVQEKYEELDKRQEGPYSSHLDRLYR